MTVRKVQKTKEPIVITDRGRPVLKVISYSEGSRSDALASLMQRPSGHELDGIR